MPLAHDKHGNYWSLVPEHTGGPSLRAVALPANDRSRWVFEVDRPLPSGPWRHMRNDELGRIGVSDGRRLLWRLPAETQQGWQEIAHEVFSTDCAITALGVEPDGRLLVGTDSGLLVSMEWEPDAASGIREVTTLESGAVVRAIHTDGHGRTRLVAGERLWCREAAGEAWQRHWRLVARLPAGNHGLEGMELNGKWYVAGGATAGYGCPVRPAYLFDEIWEYDPPGCLWRAAGKLGAPRVFPGLTALEGKIWIVGGDTAVEGQRTTTDRVEVFDPARGSVSAGPPLGFSWPTPVAGTINGRIYAAGSPTRRRGDRWLAPVQGRPPGGGSRTRLISSGKLPIVWWETNGACMSPHTARCFSPAIPASGRCLARRFPGRPRPRKSPSIGVHSGPQGVVGCPGAARCFDSPWKCGPGKPAHTCPTPPVGRLVGLWQAGCCWREVPPGRRSSSQIALLYWASVSRGVRNDCRPSDLVGCLRGWAWADSLSRTADAPPLGCWPETYETGSEASAAGRGATAILFAPREEEGLPGAKDGE